MDLRAALGTESKKDGVQSYSHKELNSAQNLNKYEESPELQMRTWPCQHLDFSVVGP